LAPWHAGTGVDRRLDDLAVFFTIERKVFARAAGSKQRGRAKRSEPLEARGVAGWVEIALGVEVGDREGKQAVRQGLLEFQGMHAKVSVQCVCVDD
jgi:hypothetical protein